MLYDLYITCRPGAINGRVIEYKSVGKPQGISGRSIAMR